MLAVFAQCKLNSGAICNAIGSADQAQFYSNNETIQQILQTGVKSQTDLFCDLNPICNRTQKYMTNGDVYVSKYTGNNNMHS